MSAENPYVPPNAEVADMATGSITKHQIKRFSPHQNAKVFAVMTAVMSLIIVVPMMLIMSSMMPGATKFSSLGMLVVPFVYLVFGYVMTVIGCAFYNMVAKFVGGIEYESEAS
jgi:lipopolysaccharide export LptBFGC system permease protein LptF